MLQELTPQPRESIAYFGDEALGHRRADREVEDYTFNRVVRVYKTQATIGVEGNRGGEYAGDRGRAKDGRHRR